MAEKPDRDQQTEAPTPKKRRDAEKKGDVLQSRELSTALVMLAGAGWLVMTGPMVFDSMKATLRAGLVLERGNLDDFDPFTRIMTLGSMVAPSLAMVFAATLVASFAAPIVLGAFGFRPSSFMPKASKMNPGAGLSRMFGSQGLTELGKSIAKVGLLGFIGWWLVSANLSAMLGLAALDPRRATVDMGAQFLSIILWLVGGLGIIGLIDTPIQFMRRHARLRMTRHEVKEENKESEGSPETKQMARQRRHDILSGSARRAVSEATVVLTNPTHFAIALRYRPGIDAVPMVVARGRGETALAMKALARDTQVPQLEYPQLTRAIYFTTRAGQPISTDLYMAVATILAFVFNLDRAMAEGTLQPPVAIPDEKHFDEEGRRVS